MPGYTPLYRFEYPVNADPVWKGAGTIERLAKSIESKISSGTASSVNADPNTVVLRDVNGRARITDPISATHISSKGYVDLIATDILAAAKLYADQGAGEPGPRGPEGPAGPAGSQGDPGPRGPAGPIGPKGDLGPRGPEGPAGAKGDPGPKGDLGGIGPKGDTGPAGPEGKGLELDGSVATYAALPASAPVGANYLVSSEGRLYTRTADGWPAEGTGGLIQGPAGAKGDTGPKGDPGPKGDTGTAGAKGDKGDPGPKGDTGTRGPEGPLGPKGDPGPRGETGLTGAPGTPGAKGDIGPKGDPGPKGDKGDPGAKGDIGPTGPGSLVAAHACKNLADVAATGTQRTSAGTITIPDPGFPYFALVFGVIEAGHFETVWTKALLEVCVGSTTGTVIARGFGPNEGDWRTVAVQPLQTTALAGARTLWLTLSSPAGERRKVQASKYYGSLVAYIYRAG